MFVIQQASISSSPTKKELGIWAENQACGFLESIGCHVLYRNLRVNRYELDIIATLPQKKHLVVCEVRARRARWCHPAESITQEKQRRIRRATAKWRSENPQLLQGYRTRFDVITLSLSRAGQWNLEHYKNAF